MNRKIAILSLLTGFILSACSANSINLKFQSAFRSEMTIEAIVNEKVRIDNMENPAEQKLSLDELKDSLVDIKSIKVKKVITSTNVDYDFCVVGDVQTEKGLVECYIYTKDVKTLSELKAGQTSISVLGYFGRFFTLLDNYYVKVEILNSEINIVEKKTESKN